MSIFVLVVVAAGWRPRLTGFLHWWVTFSLNSTALVLEGGDQVASVLTLLILPICLSDKRKWHWSRGEEELGVVDPIGLPLSFLSLLAVRLQVAFIYFSAVVEKFKVEEWMDGTALYYWVLNPYMGANSTVAALLRPFVMSQLLTPLLTWGVLLSNLRFFSD